MPTGRDIIRHRDINYRVSSVEPWGVYAVVYAVRLDTQEPIPEGSPGVVTSGGDVVLSDGDRVLA